MGSVTVGKDKLHVGGNEEAEREKGDDNEVDEANADSWNSRGWVKRTKIENAEADGGRKSLRSGGVGGDVKRCIGEDGGGPTSSKGSRDV